ncbi:hypothetical protein MAR_004093 [Mya arenaria]|uniref:Uncharacterized protein n=1 Tax=Mya arenaria TaxID=6604 RepID=A0ABY7EZR3_MYAAR|nr:hypothetical protein MAR_004093 [Mya arenaria]
MKLIQPLPSIPVKIQKVLQILTKENTGQLHSVSTFEGESNVRQNALDLQDTVLLVKLSTWELVSQDAVYHLKCYRRLFHKAPDENANDVKYMCDKLKQVHSTALAELLSYIEDTRFPELEAYTQGCDVFNFYRKGIGAVLKHAVYCNAVILAKAANIVREDIFDKKSECFVGSFEHACQDKPVP